MKNTKPSIDGFVPRRAGSQLGDLHTLKNVDDAVKPIDRSLHTGSNVKAEKVGVARRGKEIGRDDLTESLREIDDIEPSKKSKRELKRDKKNRDKRPKSKVRRIVKWVLIVVLIIAGLVGGYVVLRTVLASNSAFKGNFFDLIQNQPLKEDENGRSNFLIVGTSEDDPGHDAPYLTDTILILSINQKTKDAYMFSIPRDLNVEYGMACPEGYSGKINSYFNCINQGEDDAAEQDRLTKLQAFIGDIVGMDIQYGVHVNYTVMRDVVNAIGGSITVNIESRNPNGQMDSNFDWKCGPNYAKRKTVCPPNGHFIDYPNGPAVLDAEHALYLAQARGDIAPTYGFEQSNFDRERNQQKILVAIREKAMSAGTLTNIGAVTGLIDALGKNLRTNIQTKEVRTLMDLATHIPKEKIVSIDLHKDGEAIFSPAAQPVAGKYEFDDLRAYLKKIISQEPFVKEAPHVTVLNGSGVSGMAQTEADKLEDLGFIIDSIDNAPEGTYGKAQIYQINKEKTASAAKLKSIYGVEVLTTAPPVSVVGETDFLVIIGTSGQ